MKMRKIAPHPVGSTQGLTQGVALRQQFAGSGQVFATRSLLMIFSWWVSGTHVNSELDCGTVGEHGKLKPQTATSHCFTSGESPTTLSSQHFVGGVSTPLSYVVVVPEVLAVHCAPSPPHASSTTTPNFVAGVGPYLLV